MRATKHSHISSPGEPFHHALTQKGGGEKTHKHLLLLFPKVKSLVALSPLTAPGADADQQHHR